MNGEGFFRSLLLVGGVLLLADCASQLAQSIGSWEPGSVTWRVGNLRLLFTQVTPLLLSWVLIVPGTARTAEGWRRAGSASWALALVILVLAGMLALDAAGVAGSLTDQEQELQRRGLAQALASALALSLGLLLSGWLARRAAASLLLPPPTAA